MANNPTCPHCGAPITEGKCEYCGYGTNFGHIDNDVGVLYVDGKEIEVRLIEVETTAQEIYRNMDGYLCIDAIAKFTFIEC